MILAYIDETGDTGTNLSDPQQPIFVLGAILIGQNQWKQLEEEYRTIINDYFSGSTPENFEMHTTDMVARCGSFKNASLKDTFELRDQLLNLLVTNKIPLFYRKIEKKKYSKFCEDYYGPGVKIDPYIMAFPFVSLRVNEWLKEHNDLGIFIFDENKSHLDIEKSIRSLRLTIDNELKMENIIEKGFFVDSRKSFAVQLVDVALYYIRKVEEDRIGKPVNKYHKQTFSTISKIAVSLDTYAKGGKILDWVSAERKK